ncbi:hypothetical protein L2E82_06349 [Cichorium intybus]|uniref:Uncharacterized protein n=1 Tax=Cichorium intybus TaxID=13427 RepID=A0ACB9H9U6_CICIN|nr:hypothetical protein L2E82_06349 [Cichorium intybus]
MTKQGHFIIEIDIPSFHVSPPELFSMAWVIFATEGQAHRCLCAADRTERETNHAFLYGIFFFRSNHGGWNYAWILSRFLFPDGTVIAVTEEGFYSAPLIIESSSNVQTPNHFIRKSPTPVSRRLIYKVVTDVSPNQPRWTCRKDILRRRQGNHPFYLGSRSVNLIDADQVEKFRKKFGRIGGLEPFMEIPTLKDYNFADEHFNFSFSDEDDRRCRRTSILIYRCALFFGFPIVTFIDTLGAFADLKSEELGQACELPHMALCQDHNRR